MSQVDFAAFPQRLKQRRQDLNLSQLDLAEISGVHNMQISRYEVGAINPTVKTLTALARALNVSADWLLGLVDTGEEEGLNALNDFEREAVELLRTKPYNRHEDILEIIRRV